MSVQVLTKVTRLLIKSRRCFTWQRLRAHAKLAIIKARKVLSEAKFSCKAERCPDTLMQCRTLPRARAAPGRLRYKDGY